MKSVQELNKLKIKNSKHLSFEKKMKNKLTEDIYSFVIFGFRSMLLNKFLFTCAYAYKNVNI